MEAFFGKNMAIFESVAFVALLGRSCIFIKVVEMYAECNGENYFIKSALKIVVPSVALRPM